MDWQALTLSLQLSLITVLVLLPVGLFIGRILAYRHFPGKSLVQACFALPLVLPPTVLGYYLLIGFGSATPIGVWLYELFGWRLVFSFSGLILASCIFNFPFAILPIQRAYQTIPREVREAASCCGMSPIKVFFKIELPLAWPGVVSAMVMTFAHTLGEFGVVLMVGGNIPGETKTLAIAIYDRVQAFDNSAAATMSAFLLLFSMFTIALTYMLTNNKLHPYG